MRTFERPIPVDPHISLFPVFDLCIVKSRIIIANIDGKNPNVFYELGIAHALGKPTILISKSIENMPFDIQQNRVVLYKDNDDLEEKLSKELSRILVAH